MGSNTSTRYFPDVFISETDWDSVVTETSARVSESSIRGGIAHMALIGRGSESDLRVLIIDDDEGVRDATVACLEIAGVTNVITAPDGETGLSLISSVRPGVLLLDLFMPESDGFHVLKQLNDMPASKRPQKVVVISGANDPSVSRGLKELGADEVLPKPFRLDDLLNAVITKATPRVLAS